MNNKYLDLTIIGNLLDEFSVNISASLPMLHLKGPHNGVIAEIQNCRILVV